MFEAELLKEIKEEHEEVKALFEKLVEEEKASARKDILARLTKKLKPHMQAEEKVIYPKLLGKGNGKDVALEAFEEHHAANLVLKELVALPTDHERFKAKSLVLMEMINHHIKEEERHLFEELEDHYSREEINGWKKAFTEAKKTEK